MDKIIILAIKNIIDNNISFYFLTDFDITRREILTV